MGVGIKKNSQIVHWRSELILEQEIASVQPNDWARQCKNILQIN